jgi:hypothetical protein
MSDLTPFEKTVMRAFLDGAEPVLSILREQFERIDVVKREFTGAGFYTTFTVAAGVLRLPGNRSFNLADVLADISGLKMGASFVLFVRNGLLDMLEGCSYGEESWPPEITTFEVGYLVGNKMTNQRDIEALRKDLMP